MDFESGELGNFEHLFEDRSDAFDVGEDAFGVFVAFATVGGVFVEAEAVEHAQRFFFCLGNHLWAECFEVSELAVLDFEVGDDGAAGILISHRGKLATNRMPPS